MTAKEGVLRRRGGGGISASLYIRIRLEKFILFFLGILPAIVHKEQKVAEYYLSQLSSNSAALRRRF